MTDEEKARDALACRRCGAEIAAPCHNSAGDPLPTTEGGPVVHPARLNDWLATQGG